jgi:hypothetical protein
MFANSQAEATQLRREGRTPQRRDRGGVDRGGLCMVCAGMGGQQQVLRHISYTLDCRLYSGLRRVYVDVSHFSCDGNVITSTVHKHMKYIKQDIF